MDVQEMHIEIEQATQAIAANVRRKLYPEEVDWVLNKVRGRYIATHVSALRGNPGAEQSILHLSRLGTLLSEDTLQTYKTERGVAAALPFNISELLSVEPQVHNLCGGTASTLREAVPLHSLKITNTSAEEEFYKSVVLSIDGDTKFSMQVYAAARGVTFNGFTAADERWRLVPLLMAELHYRGYEVYWEHCGAVYQPGCILFAGLAPAATIVITIDGTVTNSTVSSTLQTKYTNTPLTYYPGRLYFQTIAPVIRKGAFSSTFYRSPLCVLQDGTVEIELADSFIVSNLKIQHVRRPRKIDINLRENCELPVDTHPDICDLATEYIKQLRSDPDWEAKLKDNIVRTTI
jgi:hypothetical protein